MFSIRKNNNINFHKISRNRIQKLVLYKNKKYVFTFGFLKNNKIFIDFINLYNSLKIGFKVKTLLISKNLNKLNLKKILLYGLLNFSKKQEILLIYKKFINKYFIKNMNKLKFRKNFNFKLYYFSKRWH